MAREFRYKGAKPCNFTHFGIFAGACGGAGGHEDARGRVESFLNEFFAENVVAIRIGGVLKIWK